MKSTFKKMVFGCLILASSQVAVGTGLSGYTVKQLLEPCVEGDNDSRWGAVAETECEQYITGFTDGLVLAAGGDKPKGICLPEQNRADEVRWAFMKWAHKNFDKRGMPAAEGLLETIRAAFAC